MAGLRENRLSAGWFVSRGKLSAVENASILMVFRTELYFPCSAPCLVSWRSTRVGGNLLSRKNFLGRHSIRQRFCRRRGLPGTIRRPWVKKLTVTSLYTVQ